MIAELVIFIILGTVAVATGVAVILSKNPVHAVLFLVINFFSVAMFYLVLSAQFVAFLQILVYAGAIMVLFLFVVMLLNLTGAIESVQDKLPAQKWVGLALGIALLLEAGVVTAAGVFRQVPAAPPPSPNFGTSAPVGVKLFFDYLLPFEVTSVLLLIAIVGSIVLARRRTY
ncbi:MAG: NADH-quinone oxidoreductase subunit J [Armatimonadetes bacterium]|nr:NADH-quinone oxidoreductase subunit J [Armatimonadota bacterium]